MKLNPYESPTTRDVTQRQMRDAIVTDWFSLTGVFFGSISAVAVGFQFRSQESVLGDSWIYWLILSTTSTVGMATIGGWLVGRLIRRLH